MSKTSPIIKNLLVITSLLISIIFIGMYYWYKTNYVSTEDAYLNADVVQVSPRVTGKILKVHVNNNQHIKKGQILFEIDPKPFEISVKEARSQLEKDLAQLKISKLTAKRLQKLSEKNVVSKQENDSAIANLEQAMAAKKYSGAVLEKAELNLSYTKVYASQNGYITNSKIQAGNIVQANAPIFALIVDNTFWVDANFKETEIEHIHKDQIVEIKIDMYPKTKFKGVVESISYGTGAAFSLLPPQNATGNWVKVTQRIPVKIRLISNEQNLPLHIGTSAKTTVNIG